VVNCILVNAINSFCRDEIAVPLAARAMQDNAEARLVDIPIWKISMKLQTLVIFGKSARANMTNIC
jgi:hypothetical protein